MIRPDASHSMNTFRRSLVLAVSAAALCAFVAGCGKHKPAHKRPLEADPTFSLNVVPVPEFWPREKFDWPKNEEMRRIRKDAWARYGTPEFIRKVYTFDGRIVRPSELEEGHVLVGARPTPVDEWIYIDEKIRVRFEGREVKESPLTDEIETVCMHGDPVAIKDFDMGDFNQRSFYYYNVGKEFVFVDGRKTDERTFATAPGAERMRD